MRLVCPQCRDRPVDARPGARCDADGALLLEAQAWRARPNDALLGRTVADKYDVIGFVGHGGMGAVYRAVQRPVGRVVALKVLAGGAGASGKDTLEQRFRTEAAAVAALRSPHAVTMFDYGEDPDGLLFIVLELVDGPALDVYLASAPELSLAVRLKIAGDVSSALAEAHALGIVHRDVKPSNIRMQRNVDGTLDARVLDFGIAKILGAGPDGRTATGQIVGTPLYMAPEQVLGQTISPATDVYALSCVLFQMLAGRPPFEGTERYEVMRAHVAAPAPELPAGVPGWVGEVVAKGLAKRPQDRFGDAGAMRRALLAGGADAQMRPVVAMDLPTEPMGSSSPGSSEGTKPGLLAQAGLTEAGTGVSPPAGLTEAGTGVSPSTQAGLTEAGTGVSPPAGLTEAGTGVFPPAQAGLTAAGAVSPSARAPTAAPTLHRPRALTPSLAPVSSISPGRRVGRSAVVWIAGGALAVAAVGLVVGLRLEPTVESVTTQPMAPEPEVRAVPGAAPAPRPRVVVSVDGPSPELVTIAVNDQTTTGRSTLSTDVDAGTVTVQISAPGWRCGDRRTYEVVEGGSLRVDTPCLPVAAPERRNRGTASRRPNRRAAKMDLAPVAEPAPVVDAPASGVPDKPTDTKRPLITLPENLN